MAENHLVSRRATTGLLVAAVVVTVAVVLSLVQQNRELRAALAGRSQIAGPAVGTDLARQDFQVGSVGGDRLSLTKALQLGTGPGVVAVFTTTCQYCAATLPIWDGLSREASETFRFAGLSLDPEPETRTYVESAGIRWPVWSLLGSDRSKLQILGVPTTFVYDKEGSVLRTYYGVLSAESAHEIVEMLSDTP